MNENMMEHLNSDYEYKWLAAICDNHNINCKHLREFKQKRVLYGFDLNPEWRIKRIIELRPDLAQRATNNGKLVSLLACKTVGL
jgi:hypothetical protein